MNTCPKCGAELRTIPQGISKKTGKPYQAFMACSDRSCDYTARLDSPAGQEIPVVNEPKGTADQLIMEELQAFRKEVNERLDSMGKWLAEHLK